jgi:hypothetical protein
MNTEILYETLKKSGKQRSQERGQRGQRGQQARARHKERVKPAT